jgi:SAM-dependent methyltransferase
MHRRKEPWGIGVKETSKAALRRSRDLAFVQEYFAGDGLDVSYPADPLEAHAAVFARVKSIVTRDCSKQDWASMSDLQDASFDFIHSSHLLAYHDNPAKVLARWLDLLKPGGYAVITVPDEDLYGKGVWPNPFPSGHKRSFTIFKSERTLPRSINLIEVVRMLAPVATCERLMLVRDHFDPQLGDIDQTAEGDAECAIELVLRKRDVPPMIAFLYAASGEPDAAQAARIVREAARTYPYNADVYYGAYSEMLRRDMPEQCDALWDQAVACLEGEYAPQIYRALHTVGRGRLQEGFVLREALVNGFGWKRRTKAEPPSHVAEWKGEPLAGKSIAIWSEFGLGDEIFFARFARIFREQCGAQRVVVVCQGPLVQLFEASGFADQIVDVTRTSELPDVDYWVYPHAILVWLPLDLEALPRTTPYLRAPEGMPGKLPDVNSGRLKVGIVFKGQPTHENDRDRSLESLAVLDDVFALEGIEFFSLQKGAGAEETARYAIERANFHDVGPALLDMADTAKAVEALDLVITVDTSVAHVAGAMDKPVWIMLPAIGDWRWHYVREDSPWYPSARLFRRRVGGEWTPVVARMVAELIKIRDAS